MRKKVVDLIASMFASLYPTGVTVIVPSGNELNKHIGEIVMSKSNHSELIEGVICKLTTEEVNDIKYRSAETTLRKLQLPAASCTSAGDLSRTDEHPCGFFWVTTGELLKYHTTLLL